MTTLDHIPLVEAIVDEIFDDSELRFYDPRRAQNALFWIKPNPKSKRSYIIFQEINTPEGERFLNPVKLVEDQVKGIRLIHHHMRSNPLGISLQMDIINTNH